MVQFNKLPTPDFCSEAMLIASRRVELVTDGLTYKLEATIFEIRIKNLNSKIRKSLKLMTLSASVGKELCVTHVEITEEKIN